MRERRWLLLTLYGLLIAAAVSDALKATRPKFKIATSTTTTTTTTTEEPAAAESADDEVAATTTTAASETNGTTGHTLTGIPQIDYIWDPNLPRELNGYNLSDYPFYASMPEDIDFKCDGLHDGFYASVPHKCQVYHHCLFGTRYDFLCANFTAFDQKTFICHFVSEVDCANSKKYWHRNDALYQAASTAPPPPPPTTTTTTTTTSAPSANSQDKGDRLPGRERDPPPRRWRPRRPAYDYYDDEYYDDDYERVRPRGYNRRDYDDYDDRKHRWDRDRDRDYRYRDFRERDRETAGRDRFVGRGNRRDPGRARDPMDDDMPRTRIRDQDPARTRDVEDRVRDGEERRYSDKRFKNDYDEKDPGPSNSGNTEGLVKPVAPPSSLYARPRPPPKLRRPVPLSEQEKYAYSTSTTTRAPIDEPRRRPAIDDLDEPRKRPMADDLDEPRRRPASDSLEEPRRRPASDSLDEPRRRPAMDSLEEPRRRPAIDSLEEPRRRPAAVDSLEEPRRRPAAVDSLEEPRRRPAAVDSLEEPRRRPAAVDSLEEPRRRPVDMTDDDDYYEDEMEEVRPRWQIRGRPLRDRDFPDKRYRDRPFRTRYRDDDDDDVMPVRPRKHPERSRDRYYERERERGPDRGRDRSLSRAKDRDRLSPVDVDKPDRASIYGRPADRDRDSERPRVPARSKDSQDETSTKKPSIYDRSTTERSTTTTSTTTTTTTTTTTPEPERETPIAQTEEPRDRSPKYSFATVPPKSEQKQYHKEVTTTEKEVPQKYWKPTPQPENQNREKEEPIEDYPSEYYDDVEEPAIVPMPPPRPTVRVIKRPFLPSRGGNPNPRGLLPVGSKAQPTSRREENPLKHYIKLQTTTAAYQHEEDVKTGSQEEYQTKGRYDNKQNYNSYKSIPQPEVIQKQQQHQQANDNYDVPVTRPALRRPEPEIPKRRPEMQEVSVPQKPSTNWDYGVQEQNNEANGQTVEPQSRGNVRHNSNQNDNSNLYSSSYKNEDVQEQLSINNNYKAKQKINEVTHHNLQDIPESEYDVTLNEALTPNLSQEPSLPSGFVLPLHRQLGRDTILQPSENSYKFSRPLNQQQKQQQQVQQQTQQQSAFVPSTQFAQPSTIVRNNDRGKTVYFRTPETIQISGSQYRQQRGHWIDYTGF